MRSLLGQLRFPREFRISRPVCSPDALLSLSRSLQTLAVESPAPTSDSKLLAKIGTGVWRMRRAWQSYATDDDKARRRVERHIDFVWDTLSENELEIQDHTNGPYVSGMSLRVIATEPSRGIDRERVIETVLPSIYFRGERIQLGEVVVGTPELTGDAS